MKKPNNYARFYALLKQVAGDAEIAKETLVCEHTGGRTTSLRDMSIEEYNAMCDALQAELNHPGISEGEYKALIKPLRSGALKRMQKLGIDTTDFDAVDAFLLNSRIAGKRFAQLTPDELRGLISKFEAILRKEPRSKVAIRQEPRSNSQIVIPLIIPTNQLPS